VHKLAVVDASIKPCDKTAEEVSESLKVLAIDLRGIDTQLTNVSQNIETRKVHDDSQLELARLQGIPGTHLDYDKINKAYDKLVGIIKLDQISLEATEKMIAEELKTVKQHQEFNTIQRTIKAVNAQKKAYNDATKGKLEVLYREQESKEDQAALVKQWLQILGPKGFRVHKMQTFLGHLNSSMKKYSDMLSDGKIRCMFYMTEGEIDFTVTDCNKTIAWSCWSEGEKARVKMACLFAVLELLEIMGAVSFNVLALDEIFSALDHAGKEGLFRVLNYLKDRGRAIYTIAHTQLALDREYDSVVKAYKQEDGTTTITQ
jgi:DNA repair exonuclease SbcCD ATPase subunit